MKNIRQGLKYLGVLFLILLGLFFLVWRIDRIFFHPYQPDRILQIRSDVETLKFSVPKSKDECLAKGGVWKKIGIRRFEECNLPTKDAGKICLGSNQCEGVCIADISSEKLREGMSGKLFYTQGKCSSFIKVVGCLGYVYRGWASVVCAD